MASPQLHRVKHIFAEALTRRGDERSAYLTQACAGDEALRAEVEAYLAAGENTPAIMGNIFDGCVPLREGPGSIIGRYKLLEQIGDGGFGVVFMAEQEHPVRRLVALKIIKLGMDTRQVVARFEAERQALAMMDHPSIAKVFDAGSTETGRPFFVMELVRGVPITGYCDEQKLSTNERLRLFASVCGAVQHAHQKGIIHRDIKPSNVLVTLLDDRPVAKVIDFGVAKATQSKLTEKTLFTGFRQMIGTPAYMSPEQAQMSGMDIDTRSDIYSLGVLLYELLTGATPFDARQLLGAAYEEMQRIIREVEPLQPSTRMSTLAAATLNTVAHQRRIDPKSLSRLFRGDLDWIVMRCLEKDRTRRYETVTGLAGDVQRYLNDEPVEARRPTSSYRLRKFIRRHKLKVIAGSAIVATLIVGLAVSTWMFLRERKARARAVAAELLAKSEAERSQQVAIELGDFQVQLSDAFFVSDRMKDAERVLRQAADIFTQASAQSPDVAFFRQQHAYSQRKLGEFLSSVGRFEESVIFFRRAIELYAQLEKDFPANAFYAQETANASYRLGGAFRDAGRDEEARTLLEQAVAHNRRGAELGNATCQDRLGRFYETGRVIPRDFAEAMKWYRLAAASGEAWSQIGLGRMYETGEGVAVDPIEAVKWYRVAADQGATAGLQHLGYMYALGKGVPRDETQAITLFAQAAERYAHFTAQGDLYEVNGLAWPLATDANVRLHDPQTAVALAQKALEMAPLDGAIRNTLGVAQDRAGTFHGAVLTLKKSIEARHGGDAFDYFFLAMAYQRLEQFDEAKHWYVAGKTWMDRDKGSDDQELIRFRREAAELIEPQSITTQP